ncbi:MAG: NAD(+) synthase, partial [Eubacteriales bacterium]|nr:NAD(+) synthase [Eubacteriales bacterium]
MYYEDGFVKVAAATPRLRVADTAYNAGNIIRLMDQAHAAGVKVLVFPELCITGYTCGDLFQQQLLLHNAQRSLADIAAHSAGLHMLVLVGLPLELGSHLFNCAALLGDGQVLALMPKTFIPNYGEFYECRYFSPPSATAAATVRLDGHDVPFGADLLLCCAELADLKVGVEICEDLWMPVSPGALHALHGATLLLNPSASNEVVGKARYRRDLVKSQSARCVCGYVYASAGDGESTTDLVFAGHNMIAENGVLLAEIRPFDAGDDAGSLLVSDVDIQKLA